MAKKNLWTKDEVKLAMYLYCQLPFGRLHSKNPEIIKLANLIGRTPGAVTYKLTNLASLDPSITSTGRSGMGHNSAVDREVWDEFTSDWEKLALECHRLLVDIQSNATGIDDNQNTAMKEDVLTDYSGSTKTIQTEQRMKQAFFRKMILSTYENKCCITGLSEPRLLVASHIVPWSKDASNRLNPRNGLCLSALHDKAFDVGLISLTDDFCLILAKALIKKSDAFTKSSILSFEGKMIHLPNRFVPEADFLKRHREEIFLG